MKTYWVIRDSSGGFWSTVHKEFKGILFATEFDSEDNAFYILKTIISQVKYGFIVKMYKEE
jgi:hypothetical protein